MTIDRGTNWAGNYSRFSNVETSRYLALLKEVGVPVLDDDFHVLQDVLLTLIRRSVIDLFGSSGSPNSGFLIVGTGAANNFTITGGGGTADTAGALYVGGLRLTLPANTTYLTQESPGPALTPPGAGTRVDTVYCDAWLDEIGPAGDPSIVDPTLGTETSRRLRLQYAVRVAQGVPAPSNYVDGNGLPHYIAPLATLNRTTSPAIGAGDVIDLRPRLSLASRLADSFAAHNAAADAHRPGTTLQTGFVRLATNPEGVAGTADDIASTPASTLAQVTPLIEAALGGAGGGALTAGINGQEILPSGRIEKWGYIPTALGGEIDVPLVFPVAFPNACWNVQAIVVLNEAENFQNSDLFMQTLPPTPAGVTLYLQRSAGGSSEPILGIYWRAVGN
ncbi:hypothetical protein [Nevskia sp.]|uniref:gp53-like domain-containing protein n=1 Tax=Nevskia sp. TaxID=1929292 RepID=UPI0025FFC5DC|nr:hypothetical protein [Nevskia sp.]